MSEFPNIVTTPHDQHCTTHQHSWKQSTSAAMVRYNTHWIRSIDRDIYDPLTTHPTNAAIRAHLEWDDPLTSSFQLSQNKGRQGSTSWIRYGCYWFGSAALLVWLETVWSTRELFRIRNRKGVSWWVGKVKIEQDKGGGGWDNIEFELIPRWCTLGMSLLNTNVKSLANVHL